MNRITLTLKRPFIWLSRFRHRCGYGVHSPFAFNLITQVIYESTPYYKYRDLAIEQKKLAPKKQEPVKARSSSPQIENFYDDDSEEQLGKEGLTAIAHTIAAFRKG